MRLFIRATLAGACFLMVPLPADALIYEIVETIQVGDRPQHLKFDPSTGLLYVGNLGQISPPGGSLSIIDTASNSVIETVYFDDMPRGMAIDSSTDRLFVPNNTADAQGDQLWILDAASGDVLQRIASGDGPDEAVSVPGSTRVYLTIFWESHVKVLEGEPSSVIKSIPVASGPAGADLDAGRGLLYVANHFAQKVSAISIADNAIVGEANVGFRPIYVAVDPSTGLVYATHPDLDLVSVLDFITNLMAPTVDTIEVGDKPLGVTVDDNMIYVANQDSHTVSIIDGLSQEVIDTFPAGSSPYDVEIDPLTGLIYISNETTDQVVVVQGRPLRIDDIINHFEEAVETGELTGSGPGGSGSGRLEALKNMLLSAERSIEEGDLDAACESLQAAAERTDGSSPPPDFVEGPAADELLRLLIELQDELECTS